MSVTRPVVKTETLKIRKHHPTQNTDIVYPMEIVFGWVVSQPRIPWNPRSNVVFFPQEGSCCDEFLMWDKRREFPSGGNRSTEPSENLIF